MIINALYMKGTKVIYKCYASLGPAMMLLGTIARKLINILEGVVTFINISYTKFIVT